MWYTVIKNSKTLEQHVIFVLLWAWNNEKKSKPLMGFKSMREELIVTKAGLGHLPEEKKTVEPQYNCGSQGILFRTFYLPGAWPLSAKSQKIILNGSRWREAIPSRSWMYNLLFGAQAKEKKNCLKGVIKWVLYTGHTMSNLPVDNAYLQGYQK